MSKGSISFLRVFRNESCSDMADSDTARRIESTVGEILKPLGFDLVEAKYMRANRNIIVRFLVDRLEGGITLEECAQLNKRIGAALDENNIIGEHYTLEVFSPGLDRFLIGPRDFRRVLNRLILVFLKEESDVGSQMQGILKRVDEEGIAVVDGEDNETYIMFTEIHKAKQVII